MGVQAQEAVGNDHGRNDEWALIRNWRRLEHCGSNLTRGWGACMHVCVWGGRGEGE